VRFRNDPRTLRGSIVPLVTPFTETGDLDVEGLRKLTSWQIAAGSHGISIGGSTGEPSAQDSGERGDAIRAVATEVADRVPFMPGTGSARLDDTLELTGLAYDAGADAVLIVTPYYAKPTQRGLFQWYSEVARSFPDLPIAIYNVPARSAVDIAPETVADLFLAFDNVVGIKETTKDFEKLSRLITAAGPELLVWSGIELLGLPLLALGGIGMISAVANIAPTVVAALFDAFDSGDVARARALHYRLHPLVDLLFVETNPAPAKWVLHQWGLLGSEMVRSPLVALSSRSRARIAELLDEAQEVTDANPCRTRPDEHDPRA
jgi:4-hydroxy-tetrahydrodipicolinate synthase